MRIEIVVTLIIFFIMLVELGQTKSIIHFSSGQYIKMPEFILISVLKTLVELTPQTGYQTRTLSHLKLET